MLKSNKELHMVEDVGVNPVVHTVSESDVAYFFEALSGRVAYDSRDARIGRMEIYLIHWLYGLRFENKYAVIVWMYERGIVDYVYEDVVYRRIDLKEGRSLEYGHYASFTSVGMVAEEFLDSTREGYTRYIFRMKGETFDFYAMLCEVERLTRTSHLLAAIEEWGYEQEKIGYFDERCEDVSAEFGLRG